jgi:hypothetical protein
MRNARRKAVVAGFATAAVTALIVASLTNGGAPVSDPEEHGGGDKEMPSALGAHLERLQEAIPGTGGESSEGPGSAAEAAFQQRAYPANTISIAKMQGAKKAFHQAVAERRVGLAPTHPWVSVGPSRAVYPFTELRNSGNYVPNTYVAGGRTTDIAIAPSCSPGDCRVWVTPAGGGVWRTHDALAKPPTWKYLGGPLGINAAGTVIVDPTDPTGRTIWVGTGEANICGSGCVAGVGIYKSTDGGNTWTGPLGQNLLGGKGIGDIVVDPTNGDIVYAATTTALRGMSSVCCSGVTRPVPGAAQWGLYKSTNGGQSWTLIHNGSTNVADCTGSAAQFANLETCSPRGVRDIELDPNDHNTIYASSYARGIWRSTDAGATWTQIKPSLNAALIQTRPAFDVTALPNGKTRMYVYEGNTGTPYSRLFRSDDVATGTPTFVDLTSADPADPGFATYNQCGAQCWYDLFVYTPDGHPDMVYTGGSYGYDETGGISNGRAVILSTDAGVSGTDMTMDGTDPVHPNGLHPDQHSIVTDPDNPFVFFETNDGGVMRSNGNFTNVSSDCANRGLSGDELTRCQQLLSSVPARLRSENRGLATLQFLSLSVSPFDATKLMGGTQDNGTWQNQDKVTWLNSMIGDGGQSGFDAAVRRFRFHNFFDASTDVSFRRGDIASWIWTADPIFGQAGTQFYAPVISDPVTSGTMFAGTGSTVYRTQTFGLGDRTIAEANAICNEWTGTFTEQCGDWAPTGQVPLTDAAFGDRAGPAVAAVERSTTDRATAWAATSTGRLFISQNVGTHDPSAITWERLDDDVTNDPGRFITSIAIDPRNPHRAWVSYSGYSATTPATPGHVFKVVFNNRSSVWTNVSGSLADLPVNDLVRDDRTGDLYAATDFGVLRKASGSTTWTLAAPGMPNVEIAGLTILPNKRILYAASHGLSAWKLTLG